MLAYIHDCLEEYDKFCLHEDNEEQTFFLYLELYYYW
jgi:hypothetical protein